MSREAQFKSAPFFRGQRGVMDPITGDKFSSPWPALAVRLKSRADYNATSASFRAGPRLDGPTEALLEPLPSYFWRGLD